MRKIAVLTSGGDAPGMNSALRAIIKSAKTNGLEAFVVYEGYKGLYEGNIVPADTINFDAYNNLGGTVIYSARFPEFKNPEVRQVAINNLKSKDIDALVVIGGDGSYMGAQLLHEAGVKTVGLPGTIDNDIASSDFTIGYDTALNTVVDAIDKIRDTATSHRRIMVVEVMGNQCGDLALWSGLATGAEIISTSENTLSVEEIVQQASELAKDLSRRSIMIVVSEKRYNITELAKEIEKATKWETRPTSLGHIQRGGRPSAQERISAALMGIKAVEFLLEGQSGIAIGIIKGDVVANPILEALSMHSPAKAKAVERANKFNKLNKIK
ncbi:6-phosphofructokinase [Mycoplasmopsis pullorum]|uniref:6-phosphofructokinase n=1 Tax=Mycoplasmopsis pullorum TaxID=48003 RepID=UPI0011198772|nr:6-phosphofructokinase [Mycoplasmopsis pullorum]TNK82531.1 6-phosphofructokinase [Mycoplasmopsis pullorum]TNK83314.1 6-phosphofructokinase [Mycoplasmopsis pullorum]TNK84480.1 6-phosphofructokinase [Mycoplasmopsis pullorum]TNK84987.1 6-phosphofructokinase [Mycoplasmopsis pullorum]TNK86313.1 6-phosphofructokinase [Mycoplasmopsis pullorum]